MQLLAWMVTALLLAPAEGFMGSALVGGRSSRQHRMTRMVVAADDTTRVDAINGFSSAVRAKLLSGADSQQFAAIMEEFLEGYTR
ncbi:hypothetical protein JKP88DRAFT_272391 [Tribonema minus]|uniref:Uncharacterized protein n=1 Tax=Tribonema minus TaxID=303371 RepID=A0A836CPT3_9STRA|nr:hypothetical protein JKP88DRAFT_272391 [Tribonema minus]